MDRKGVVGLTCVQGQGSGVRFPGPVLLTSGGCHSASFESISTPQLPSPPSYPAVTLPSTHGLCLVLRSSQDPD